MLYAAYKAEVKKMTQITFFFNFKCKSDRKYGRLSGKTVNLNLSAIAHGS